MYVCQPFGPPYWKVCEDDGTILKTFRSKGAATRWMRDMQRSAASQREQEQEAAFNAADAARY